MSQMAPQAHAWLAGGRSDDVEFKLNDLDDPIPEGLPEMTTYRMLVMPVGVKKEIPLSGGKKIILPDESVDANEWLHSIGRIAKLGPACFMHPKYKELGLKRSDFPDIGDLILYSAQTPRRFQFNGRRFIVLNDDHFFATITDEATVGRFKFYA